MRRTVGVMGYLDRVEALRPCERASERGWVCDREGRSVPDLPPPTLPPPHHPRPRV